MATACRKCTSGIVGSQSLRASTPDMRKGKCEGGNELSTQEG
jgi:hypothetical protein